MPLIGAANPLGRYSYGIRFPSHRALSPALSTLRSPRRLADVPCSTSFSDVRGSLLTLVDIIKMPKVTGFWYGRARFAEVASHTASSVPKPAWRIEYGEGRDPP